MKKQYTFENIKYGYSVQFRKWIFTVGKNSFLYSVKNGKETAHKIAHLIHGSFIRVNKMDNLARSNINRVNA